MNDMSLIVEFVQEAREYIEEVEPTLIELFEDSDEDGAVDAELVNMVFRLFHSMKGSAGFLGLTTITAVTHEAETVLDEVRRGNLGLTHDTISVLCKAIDLFRVMLDHIEETGEDDGFGEESKEICEQLLAIGSQGGVPEKEMMTDDLFAAAVDDLADEVSAELQADSTVEIGKLEAIAAEAQEMSAQLQSNETDVSDQCNLSQNEPMDAIVSQDLAESTPAVSTPVDSMAAELSVVQLSPEMRQGFVTEGTEQIDCTELSLLAVLESSHGAGGSSGAGNDEPLREAFRNIHSFKGNCGFMGFSDLEKLSHRMEASLECMRENQEFADTDRVNSLLKMLDVLREAITSIESGQQGSIKECDAHLAKLDSLLNSLNVHAGEEKKESQVADASEQRTEKAKPEAKSKPGAKAKKVARQDIRVDLGKLDSLINLVGELVIAESMVTRCPAVAQVEDEYYFRATHQLRRICENLKDVAMAVRMIPLSPTFRKMIRLVHDLSQKSGKKIKLTLIGEDTEVDKTVIERIADPLVHIVRNSCDHGIGPTEDRIAAGKPEMGSVTLEGRHEGGEVWILIKDDGRGLDREKILAKGIDRGLVQGDGRDWSDERIFRLVFEPGFSTAEKVTDVSGRGVGMDVVKKNIEKLNGRIDVKSKLGEGTTFILRIPLTLAIIDGMLIRVGTQQYMIPTLSIRESLQPIRSQIVVTPDGNEILRLRDEFIPIIRVHSVFGSKPDYTDLTQGILVVVEDSGMSVAIFTDEILGQQQTVIKGLSEYVSKARGLAGCTILGNGSVSLILNIRGMIDLASEIPSGGALSESFDSEGDVIDLGVTDDGSEVDTIS